ncbi:MAG TPA: hypothetical protein VF025_08320 [Gaiellaceae bacterium]
MGLLWLAVILGLVWLVRDKTDLRQRPPEETALTILDRHFAEGGISLDDYDERRAVLTGATRRPTDQDITSDASERSQP